MDYFIRYFSELSV